MTAAPPVTHILPDVCELLARPIDTFITIDFETFFDGEYSLSKMPTADYVRDERFEVIGVGVKVNASPPVWMEEAEFRAWVKTVDWSRASVLAHNTQFDGFVLAHHYGVKPALWLCTLSMSRPLHGVGTGSLEKLAPLYDAGVKGHEVLNAKGKRRADFTREEWLRYGEYCKNDVALCYGIFQGMAARGFPEVELFLIDMTIRMFTEPTFVLDEPLLEAYLVEERARKAALLDRVARDKSVLMSNDKFAALLLELGEEPPRKISPRKSKTAGEPVWTYAFAKSDPGMQALLEHDRDEIRWLAEARVGVKSTINETRTERFLKSGKGGRPLPVFLRYCAAHTHRWGGGDRMNFQNLQRGGTLRKALLVPPGCDLVVADSGQIEPRVTGWLAEDFGLLDVFRRNDALGKKGDFYSDRGSAFFGKKLSKDETPLERQVAKSMLIGLGYAMGWFKFSMELAKGANGTKPVVFTWADAEKFNVNVEKWAAGGPKGGMRNRYRVEDMPSRIPFQERLVHCAVTAEMVRRYREVSTSIVELWGVMEEVLELMLEDEADYPIGPGGCMRAVRHAIIMPNGLPLKYPGLSKSKDGFSYMGGKSGRERVKAYGGSMVENVVQCLARIIVGEQALRIQASGVHIVTTSHDEVVGATERGRGAEVLERAVGIMRIPPVWARGLPLNAEGGYGSSYGQVK